MIYKLLDIPIHFDKISIQDVIDDHINNESKGYICTVNANLMVHANRSNSYHEILKKSLINICDGSVLSVGLSWVYKQKLNPWPGPDFFLDYVQKKQIAQYFLGTNTETLHVLKQNLINYNDDLSKAVFMPLPFMDVEDFDYLSIARNINTAMPDIIWLAIGAPKQEIFASKLLPYIEKGIVICVGAAFDFYGNNTVKRAPLIIRKLRQEWLWRLFFSPGKTVMRLKDELFIMPKILLLEKKNNLLYENTNN